MGKMFYDTLLLLHSRVRADYVRSQYSVIMLKLARRPVLGSPTGSDMHIFARESALARRIGLLLILIETCSAIV
jgi:hypothetical protein